MAPASDRVSQRLFVSRSCTARTGTSRRTISSKVPRISEMSLCRSSERVSAASSSPSACRRSRCRGVFTSGADSEDEGSAIMS
jgi:hypothetical protein